MSGRGVVRSGVSVNGVVGDGKGKGLVREMVAAVVAF